MEIGVQDKISGVFLPAQKVVTLKPMHKLPINTMLFSNLIQLCVLKPRLRLLLLPLLKKFKFSLSKDVETVNKWFPNKSIRINLTNEENHGITKTQVNNKSEIRGVDVLFLK